MIIVFRIDIFQTIETKTMKEILSLYYSDREEVKGKRERKKDPPSFILISPSLELPRHLSGTLHSVAYSPLGNRDTFMNRNDIMCSEQYEDK